MSRKNPFVMPILKWVGGKRQLLDSINPLIPECSTYYEPFIGGGAVLFGRQPNKAVINDSNEELINVYRMIKEEPEALIAALSAHKEQNCEEYYYMVRSWDRDKESPASCCSGSRTPCRRAGPCRCRPARPARGRYPCARSCPPWCGAG